MRRTICLGLLILSCSCTIPETTAALDQQSPPLELGRPGWVRTTARIGAVTGSIVGGVLSLVALPVTYPISLLADEPLGVTREQFRFAPVSVLGGLGHGLLGGPADVIDWTVRRAWSDETPMSDFEFTPMHPPVGPGIAEPTTPVPLHDGAPIPDQADSGLAKPQEEPGQEKAGRADPDEPVKK